MNTYTIMALLALALGLAVLVRQWRNKRRAASARQSVQTLPVKPSPTAGPTEQQSEELTRALRQAWAYCGHAHKAVKSAPECEPARKAYLKAVAQMALLQRKLQSDVPERELRDLASEVIRYSIEADEKAALFNRLKHSGNR